MEILSEQEIKKRAVNFLRAYYRYRPFSGSVRSSIDMQGEGGIKADGYLAFEQKDGSTFLATVEATSYGSVKEVRYSRQRGQLRWDGAAVSAMGVAGLLFGIHTFGFYFSVHYNILVGILGALSLWLIGMLLYNMLLRRYKRYRAIYAIEQFKQYHADEQWIAIGEDVFPSLEDEYYKELRRQCVFNGFGLLMISRKGHSRVLVTPSPQELFHHSRRRIAFLPLDVLSKRLKQAGDANWVKQFTGMIAQGISIRGVKIKPVQLRHFNRPYSRQFLLTGLSAAIAAVVLWLDWQHRPVIYVNEYLYEREMIAQSATMKSEAREYILDVPPIPYDSVLPPPLEWYIQVQSAIGDSYANPLEEAVMVSPDAKGTGWVMYFDCERFTYTAGNRFAIRDKMTANLDAAKSRITALRKAGVPAAAISAECLPLMGGNGFMVYLDLLHTDSLEAARRLQTYRRRLDGAGLKPELSVVRFSTSFSD